MNWDDFENYTFDDFRPFLKIIIFFNKFWKITKILHPPYPKGGGGALGVGGWGIWGIFSKDFEKYKICSKYVENRTKSVFKIVPFSFFPKNWIYRGMQVTSAWGQDDVSFTNSHKSDFLSILKIHPTDLHISTRSTWLDPSRQQQITTFSFLFCFPWNMFCCL